MTITHLLIHPVAIWRSTPGAVDDYNVPTPTWALHEATIARITPKTGREMAQVNQAGPRAGDYRVYLDPTDVTEGDHIVDAAGRIYEIGFVAERSGEDLHHLELDVTKVYP